ncbi:MAG: adenosylmethionine decarboxylase [Thermodesulfobacteriota bacterium]|nr:adenosylmethionine decarboxylase [Thermodesulfobacteriota bacterium]
MKPLGTHHVAEFIYCSEDILNDRIALEEALRIGIGKSGLTLITTNSYQFNPIGVTVIGIIGESHVAIHTYPEARHASVDIFSCSTMSEPHMRLLDSLKSELMPKSVRIMELLRGNPLDIANKDWITTFSGYGFEVRYHITKEILSRKSKYQQIDIIENENFGRMLFLDKDLQIAEKDAHIYNMSMVYPLIEAGKKLNKVAILGGGDGGVLSELLKYNPKSVVLVDIDEEVIKVSHEFLKPISNEAFNHPNVEVVIDDAYTFLENQHGFDAVIYDLTMHPEAFIRIERSIFLNDLFLRINKSLLKGGMVTLQCCSEYDEETFQLIEGILSRYFTSIDFRKSFIPSFCENWVFASAVVA